MMSRADSVEGVGIVGVMEAGLDVVDVKRPIGAGDVGVVGRDATSLVACDDERASTPPELPVQSVHTASSR